MKITERQPTTALELLKLCTDDYRVFWITDGSLMLSGEGDSWDVTQYENHEWVKDICRNVSEAEAVAAMWKGEEVKDGGGEMI